MDHEEAFGASLGTLLGEVVTPPLGGVEGGITGATVGEIVRGRVGATATLHAIKLSATAVKNEVRQDDTTRGVGGMHHSVLLDAVHSVVVQRDPRLQLNSARAYHSPHFFHVKRESNHDISGSSDSDHWLQRVAIKGHACRRREP
jgi:hypothetical protein